MSSVKKNFAYNAAYQILLIITPLITTPYLSRVLGPTQVGVFGYTQSVANYFVLFAVLGMSTYGVRAIAACKDDRQVRSQIFWSAYASQLLVGIPVLAAYVVYALISPGVQQIISLMWLFWVISSLLDVSWLLFGVEEFKIPTIRSTVIKIIEVALIFVFVKSAEDLPIYVAIFAGSFLFMQASLWPFVPRYVDRVRPAKADVLAHIPPNARLFVPVVAISLYTLFDKVLLGNLASFEQTGYFEYSEKLSRMPLAVITALGTVMLPRMSSLLSSGKKREALELLERSLWFMLLCAFCLAFGIAACAQEFAPVFLGEEFAPAAPVMAVLACIVPVVSMTNVIGRQYLLPTFKDIKYTVSCCVGAAVNLTVNLVLIPRLGALGAACATVAAESSVLVVQVVYVHKELPLARYAKGALPFLVIGAVMALAIRLCSSLIIPALGISAIALLIEVAVGAAVFVAGTLIWCIATHNRHARALVGPLIGMLKQR